MAHIDRSIAHRIARIQPRDWMQKPLAAHGEERLHVEARPVHVAGEQRDIDLLALAGRLAVMQGGHDTERQHHRRVHLPRAGKDRRLAGLRKDRHHPGACRRQLIERRQVTIRAFRSEACPVCIDDIGPERAECPVVESLRSQNQLRSIGDEHIGRPDEPPQDIAPTIGVEIQRQALLVAVQF